MRNGSDELIKRVIWAVDPFEGNSIFHQNCGRMIGLLCQHVEIQVQPVYILSSAQINLPTEKIEGSINHYQPAAEKMLKDVIGSLGIPNIDQPQVLLHRSSSSAEASDILSAYALSMGANLILVSSHGRTGIKRVLLGSFAETLLLRSKVQVLVVGSKVRSFRPLTKILFPTKFGEHSKVVFRRAVRIAQSLSAELVLFHMVPDPIEPIFQSGVSLLGGTWIPVHSYFGREIERQTRRANAWARWAEAQGVPTEVMVQSKEGMISAAIISTARKKRVGCIVMEAQTGMVEATLIGSITREVIRGADCPVWVLRASMLEAEKESKTPGRAPEKKGKKAA